MKYRTLHKWNITPKEAIRLQYKLQKMYVPGKLSKEDLRLVAGVDVSVKDNLSRAAIVVLSYPDLQVKETVLAQMKTQFPYVPGLLSFREAPVILKCLRKLKKRPDLFIFDGQGLAHPRKMGLATHMGIILNKPSIGSAKSHLYGNYLCPGGKKGNFSLMRDKGGTALGAAVRSRDNTNPIFVSPGHLVDIPSAVDIVLSCCPEYKLPEPIRAAHNAASLA